MLEDLIIYLGDVLNMCRLLKSLDLDGDPEAMIERAKLINDGLSIAKKSFGDIITSLLEDGL